METLSTENKDFLSPHISLLSTFADSIYYGDIFSFLLEDIPVYIGTEDTY